MLCSVVLGLLLLNMKSTNIRIILQKNVGNCGGKPERVQTLTHLPVPVLKSKRVWWHHFYYCNKNDVIMYSCKVSSCGSTGTEVWVLKKPSSYCNVVELGQYGGRFDLALCTHTSLVPRTLRGKPANGGIHAGPSSCPDFVKQLQWLNFLMFSPCTVPRRSKVQLKWLYNDVATLDPQSHLILCCPYSSSPCTVGTTPQLSQEAIHGVHVCMCSHTTFG